MSFSFGFDEDVMDQDEVTGGVIEGHHPINQQQEAKAHPTHSIANRSLSLASLLETLPDRISYSTISTQSSASGSTSSSSSSSQTLYLPRRDLFDARFQILHEQTQDVDGDDQEPSSQPIRDSQQQDDSGEGAAVVGTESDLIPGLYEGGLKTWECSVDLAIVVHGLVQAHGIEAFQGKNIVELGCGTALPSCMLLQLLLSSPPPTSPPSTPTTIHLCDYNLKVLELVTLANLLLAYHFITATSPDLTGELDLTPEFLQGFTESLEARSIRLTFHSGPWEGLNLSSSTAEQASKADYIFTSETTYTPNTIDSLLSTLHRLARPTTSSAVQTGSTILVATKNYYFGLGGGVHALRQALLTGSSIDRATAAWAEEVTSTTKGVARSVLRIGWN